MVPQGSEGDPACIFFTLNTYKVTFISYILEYNCREWSFFRTHGRTHTRTDTHTDGWTDKRGSRNSYLDVHLGFHKREELNKIIRMSVKNADFFSVFSFFTIVSHNRDVVRTAAIVAVD